jgi:hypothetical protein
MFSAIRRAWSCVEPVKSRSEVDVDCITLAVRSDHPRVHQVEMIKGILSPVFADRSLCIFGSMPFAV